MCCIMGYAGRDLSKETFTEYLLRTTSRGPDDQRVAETEFGLLGFGRLAIMGLTPEGMQPFFRGADCVACNGELYGFRPVKAELEAEGYTFESDSDCEIILPLYYKYGLDMFRHLDAEFAMILYDSRKKLLIAARDPIGIRPLFYGYSESGHIAFASEAKNLVGLCKKNLSVPDWQLLLQRSVCALLRHCRYARLQPGRAARDFDEHPRKAGCRCGQAP